MDKTTAILGGVFGGIVLLLVFAFYFSPHRTESLQQELTIPSVPNLKTDDRSAYSPRNTISLAQLFEKSQDGVVKVSVRKSNQTAGARSVGSGFVYDVLGHIITNSHVVDAAQKITVTFLDGTSYNAKVVGMDKFTDIAVIEVNADRELLHPLPIGDSSQLHIGDPVAAIGNPFGLSGSMTSGIVSQVGRLLSPPGNSPFSIPDVIQTDAAINPGNSGGPLLNMKGEVIGINTAIQSDTGEFTGVGFAVPSITISKIAPVLIKDGHYHHTWLGITGIDVDSDVASVLSIKDARGFLVVSVVKGSPADRAGLHGSTETKEVDGIKYQIGGDLILSVDQKKVRKIDDILIYLQREKSVGDKIVLEVLRNGQVQSIDLILEERPSQT